MPPKMQRFYRYLDILFWRLGAWCHANWCCTSFHTENRKGFHRSEFREPIISINKLIPIFQTMRVASGILLAESFVWWLLTLMHFPDHVLLSTLLMIMFGAMFEFFDTRR